MHKTDMAQNIEHKKSTLDDDASIYQKKEERDDAKTTKQKWSSLSTAEKWQYFKDYYMKKVLIIGIILIVVTYSIYSSFRDSYTTKYYLAVLNEFYFDNDAMEEHLVNLEKQWNFDKREKAVYSTDLSMDNSTGTGTFVTYLFAGSLNAVIGSKGQLEKYGSNFTDYSEKLPEEIYNSIPEEAWCDLSYKDPDAKPNETKVETGRCGIYIKHTIFADLITEGVKADDLILVFPTTGGTDDEAINYNLEFFKYAVGYEPGE